MDSYYIQQARKYKDQYEQLKDKNPEQAEKKKQLALRYLDLNRKQEAQDKITKRLRESNPSTSDPYYLQQAKIHNQNYELFKDTDPEQANRHKQIAKNYIEMHQQEEENKQSEKDRNERLGQIFGIRSDSDVADEAAELGIDIDSQADTNTSVDIPDNINDNETVSSTINPDLETQLNDQDSSSSLPSYRSTFSLGENPPSSRSSFSSSTLPSRSSSSNSSTTTSSSSLPSRSSSAVSSLTNSSNLPRSRSNASVANGPLVVNLGFTESLRRHSRKSVNNRVANPNICKNIFMNGLNVNSQYFYPSEFPNLTKIKSVPIITQGGKRTRKHKSKKRKYRKNTKIN
jgi:hypothetical protein